MHRMAFIGIILIVRAHRSLAGQQIKVNEQQPVTDTLQFSLSPSLAEKCMIKTMQVTSAQLAFRGLAVSLIQFAAFSPRLSPVPYQIVLFQIPSQVFNLLL